MSVPLPTAEASDAELLASAARGDIGAFGVLYDRHAGVLFSLALRILNDRQEAEEVLQEAMVVIWERAAQYNPTAGKPLSWAVTIARNKAIDRLRSMQRKTRLLRDICEEGDSFAEASPQASPSSTGDAAAIIRAALARLPREQRVAIELAFMRGLTQTEVAEHLGDPLGTVKARIRRGMIALRDSLTGYL